jgi:hypothetical protein
LEVDDQDDFAMIDSPPSIVGMHNLQIVSTATLMERNNETCYLRKIY